MVPRPHRQPRVRLRRRRRLEVAQRLREEKVVPPGDEVERRRHDGARAAGAELAQRRAFGPERAVGVGRRDGVAVEGPPPPQQHLVELEQRRVPLRLRERAVAESLEEGDAQPQRGGREGDEVDVEEPVSDELERETAGVAVAVDRRVYRRLRDHGNARLHRARRRRAHRRPRRQPEVRAAEDADAAVAPRLLPHPRHRRRAVVALLLDRHEHLVGAEAAARVLEEHRVAALGEDDLAPLDPRALRAVRRAHDHRREALARARRQPQRAAQHLPVADGDRVDAPHRRAVRRRVEPARAREAPPLVRADGARERAEHDRGDEPEVVGERGARRHEK